MSRPRFLADENFQGPIVAAVRLAEPLIEIATVVDFGLRGRPDEWLLEFAATNGLIILSHDRSTMPKFAKLRFAAGKSIAGVFIFDQDVQTRIARDELVMIWATSDSSEWVDRVEFLPM